MPAAPLDRNWAAEYLAGITVQLRSCSAPEFGDPQQGHQSE
ncbi:hypothetical protein OS122_22905 [Mycolicibacterium mucogenicum]|nr:hypothetical protein [Mycolicibacterium mucogenicum]MCX8563752.1 hypothetical protein [Mycolicibacterium mucogenicum]